MRQQRRHPLDRFAWCRCVAALLLLGGCSALGPPPMEPLTEGALAAAERRWQAHRTDSYHLVVRVRAPRFDPALFDVVVERGQITRIDTRRRLT